MLSENALKSLAYAGAQFLLSIILTFVLIRLAKISFLDKIVIWWNCYDIIVHVTLESAFLYYSLTSSVHKSEGFLADVWKEYGKADSRWAHSDPTIISLELLTVFLCSFLCIVLIYAIIADKPYRHTIQIIIQICELYGGWMTFCPEWITGSPSLDTSNPLYLWVYMFFFNFLWVIFPFLLLWQSWTAIAEYHTAARKKKRN